MRALELGEARLSHTADVIAICEFGHSGDKRLLVSRVESAGKLHVLGKDGVANAPAGVCHHACEAVVGRIGNLQPAWPPYRREQGRRVRGASRQSSGSPRNRRP